MHISLPFIPFFLIGCIICLVIILLFNNNKNNQKENKNDFIDQSGKELNNMVNTFAEVGKQALDATSDALNNATKKQYCTNCGTKIDKDSKFCKNCGKEI